MKAWLNAHGWLVIGAVFLIAISIGSVEEIIWIAKDEQGKKGRRAARRILRATAFVSGGIVGICALFAPLLIAQWSTRWACAAALLVTFIALGGPFFAARAMRGPDRHGRGRALTLLGGALVRVFFGPAVLLCLYLIYSAIRWIGDAMR
jgi:hypothetical protein